MTAEKRLVAKLSDIVLVRFECRKCHSVFSWPLAEWKRVPYACQNCEAPWFIHGSPDEAFVQGFKEMVQRFQQAETKFPFELALEFDEAEEK